VNPLSRRLVVFLALGLASLAAWPQSDVARIGLFGPDEQPRFSDIAAGLKQGLREQGHADGAIEIMKRV
jgi:hypothetical protein